MRKFEQFSGLLSKFAFDDKGHMTVQTALLFGAVILSMSVLAAPHLQNAADRYAENRALGIDPTTTSSIKEKRTFTIRKSVLD